MKWPRNPFPFGTPVMSEDLFIDRQNELQRLVESVGDLNMTVVLIEGARRIGKSSLLKQFHRKITAEAISVESDVQDLEIAHGTPVSSEVAARAVLFDLGKKLLARVGIGSPAGLNFELVEFNTKFLLPALQESESKRLVLLIDELDILQERYPAVIEEVLSAFRVEFSPPPLIVLCCGRKLGAPRTGRLAQLLKASLPIDLEPFDETITKSATELAGPYKFSDAARNLFWEVTQGHPLWITAINHLIYSSRSRTGDGSEVGETELRAALEPASKWFKNAIWQAWRQVTPLQSLFARAVADITWSEQDSRFVGVATISQIEAELRPFFSRVDADQLSSAAAALKDNHILWPEGEGYRLYAPFLGYWLRQQEPSELRLAGDPKAADYLTEAREYQKQGDVSSALAAVTNALEWDPVNTDALLMASDLASESGDLDLAIWWLEEAASSKPQTVKLRLSKLLVRRIKAAVLRGESPDPWYHKLYDLDQKEADATAVIREIAKYHLDRWERLLRSGDGEAAQSVLEELANRNLRGWRRLAAKKYSEVVQSLLQEDDFVHAALAVRDAFPILVQEPIKPIHPDRSGFELELLSKFPGDAGAQEKIHEHFKQYADRYPWWTSTLSTIRRSLESGNTSKQDWLPLQIVEKIARRAPSIYRKQMDDDLLTFLPGRLSDLLADDPEESANAIRLLFETENKTDGSIHRLVDNALLNHLVHITDATDDEVVKFFRRGARAYLLWADSLTPGNVQTANILEQVDLLLDRMKAPRGPVPQADQKWELFIRGGEGLTAWQDLLRHKVLKGQHADRLLDEIQPPEHIDRAIRMSSLGAPDAWNREVEPYLSSTYQNVRHLRITIPGIPAEAVKFYQAHWSGEEVNLKVYRVSAHGNSREFLTYLWEKERRALINLSTRLSGRALSRFKFSHTIPAGEEGEYLVIVTEPSGSRTLRDHLRHWGRGRLQNPDRRRELWQAIHALVEGVNALHKAHYLHRSIRPENIFVQDDDKLSFKLGNFEWSLYLHSLADEFPREERWVDRYTAPEVLAARFNKKDHDVGEGFSSEVYSLGLVLFELLVRRLTDREIGRYYRSADYNLDDHREWLHGLRKELRDELKGSDKKDERLLLLEMLQPSTALRRSDLDDLVQLTESMGWDFIEIEQLLHERNPYLTTTLTRGTEVSIERFLNSQVKPLELGETESDLLRFLQRELAGARVYRNANRDQPLFIEGRRVLFAATPFVHVPDGRRKPPTLVNEIPYLTVATALDRREGSPLVRLPRGLPVVDLNVAHKDLSRTRRETLHKGEAWRRLFDLSISGTDRLPRRAREFYTILQITAEVEEKLWQQQVVPYEIVSKTQKSHLAVIVIKNPTGGPKTSTSVGRVVAQQTTRGERFFELNSNDSPLAPLQLSNVWKLEKVDTAQGTVQLSRETTEWPPDQGFIRPQSLSGNRALRKRRAETLFSLRDDEYLLRAVTDISTIQERWPTNSLQYFDSGLDHDKQRIVRNILSTRPLYLVQGPPGTGKTTLAAEIIRQEIDHNPSARILVTSQSHEPLNNLLMRVHRAFENVDKGKRPSAVRLFSSARLQSRRWSEETRNVMRDFQPAEVAKRYVNSARNWQPSLDSGVDADLVRRWRAWLETNSKNLPVELERKIIASANLLYATANDRSIAQVPEHREFDLLIFEEAAKAYPLEVLGPMRLSRRWLLIGDHKQLSAFNIEDFRSEARETTNRLYHVLNDASSRDQRQSRGMGLIPSSSHLATRVADFFEYLFNEGINNEEGAVFADRLSLQWRMHPEISGMIKEIYYEFLTDGDPASLKKKHTHRISYPPEFRRSPIIWIDVPLALEESPYSFSDEALTAEVPFSGGGFRNPFEARVLHNVMSRIQVAGRGGLAGNIAFLSPYKAQVDLINKFFRSWDGGRNPQTGDLRQKAYTVDSFQGRQAEIVVVSLVRNNRATEGFDAYGFLEGEVGRARAAVMFSRAERLLVIIGCSKHFLKQFGFHIGRVFEYVQQKGLVIEAKQFLAEKDYQDLSKYKKLNAQRMARNR